MDHSRYYHLCPTDCLPRHYVGEAIGAEQALACLALEVGTCIMTKDQLTLLGANDEKPYAKVPSTCPD
jgi:hypothetical protein